MVRLVVVVRLVLVVRLVVVVRRVVRRVVGGGVDFRIVIGAACGSGSLRRIGKSSFVVP